MNRITQYLSLDDLAQVDDEAFAFDGSDLDAASLHNHQIRHYDPTPGKWLSEDPIAEWPSWACRRHGSGRQRSGPA